MTDHGKAYGENPPTAFPKALEIERTDFHISSAPTTAANLTQFKTRKEPFPVRLTFAPFRLILRLEKTCRGTGMLDKSASPNRWIFQLRAGSMIQPLQLLSLEPVSTPAGNCNSTSEKRVPAPEFFSIPKIC